MDTSETFATVREARILGMGRDILANAHASHEEAALRLTANAIGN